MISTNVESAHRRSASRSGLMHGIPNQNKTRTDEIRFDHTNTIQQGRDNHNGSILSSRTRLCRSFLSHCNRFGSFPHPTEWEMRGKGEIAGMPPISATFGEERFPFMAFQTISVKWPKAENLDFPSGQTLVRASILLVFCLETTFVFLH